MCDILIDNYIERVRYLILKLSISNIAWSENEDEQVYVLMQKYGFTGLEIAPTRIFPSEPYGDLDRVREWAVNLESEYGFVIPSMQSIWFGRQEKLFGSSRNRHPCRLSLQFFCALARVSCFFLESSELTNSGD